MQMRKEHEWEKETLNKEEVRKGCNKNRSLKTKSDTINFTDFRTLYNIPANRKSQTIKQNMFTMFYPEPQNPFLWYFVGTRERKRINDRQNKDRIGLQAVQILCTFAVALIAY